MKTNQTGFSLVEMMVAMTISLVLVLGVATIMISSKRSYNVQQDMARMQENARFAIEFLNKDLRMTGNFGCSGEVPNGITRLSGTEGAGGGADTISVNFADSNQNAFSVVHTPLIASAAVVSAPLNEGNTTFNFNVRGNLNTGDTVIASDCGGSDAYTITDITDTTVALVRGGQCKSLSTSTNGLCKTYNNNGLSDGGEIRRLVTYTYSILAATSGVGFSLFRNADELVEGVENMQIRYGVNNGTNNGANMLVQYQTANNITNWNNILSVRIYLVVNTIKQRFDKELDTQTYDVGELQPYNPDDDYRRRTVFTTTVMLRN
ncbi:MAG: PilW family protein [Thiomargarita sp.]|nr:PilW family protein [Thiomargarita sp.]